MEKGGHTRGVFKSSCANAQAHSGQEFPTLTTGGRSIDLIFWEPKSFGCRQQITGGAAFALSDKFLKIKFLQLQKFQNSVTDHYFHTLNCLMNMFAKPIYIDII